MDQEYAKMEFIRFENCVVSSTPLQKYCAVHASPVITLVFMKDFKELPLVGFSICSAWEIITDKLHPNQTIAHMKWDSPNFAAWARRPVKKDDYLRMLLKFEKNRLCVRFKFNLSPASDRVIFDYIPNQPDDLYLALASREMFDEPDTSPIAVLSASEMLTWTNRLRNQRELVIHGEQKDEERLVTVSRTSQSSAESGPPMCTLCWEKAIDTLLMPCNHALCCSDCKESYISHERNKQKMASSKSTEVVCPICRVKLESVAQIWFPKSNRCLLCAEDDDCGTMSAVAGGSGGCGCVIGCYEKARKLCDRGGKCPNCDGKLVDVLQVFIQSDRGDHVLDSFPQQDI